VGQGGFLAWCWNQFRRVHRRRNVTGMAR
jgi:hypothetical protein